MQGGLAVSLSGPDDRLYYRQLHCRGNNIASEAGSYAVFLSDHIVIIGLPVLCGCVGVFRRAHRCHLDEFTVRAFAAIHGIAVGTIGCSPGQQRPAALIGAYRKLCDLRADSSNGNRIAKGRGCSILKDRSDLIGVGGARHCRGIAVAEIFCLIELGKVIARALSAVDLVVIHIGQSEPIQRRLTGFTANTARDHRLDRRSIRHVQGVILLVVAAHLHGADHDGVAINVCRGNRDLRIRCRSKLFEGLAIGRTIEDILRLAERRVPGEDGLIALGLHLNIGGQIRPDLIGYGNGTLAISAPLAHIHINAVLGSGKGHGGGTHFHVVFIGRVIVSILARLGQDGAILRDSSGGRCPSLAGVGADIIAQRHVRLVHVNAHKAALLAHSGAVLAYHILVAAGIRVVNVLGCAGGGGVVAVTVHNAGGGLFNSVHFFADAGFGIVVADLLADRHPAGLQNAAQHVIGIARSILNIAGEVFIRSAAHGTHSLRRRRIQLALVAELDAIGLQRKGVDGCGLGNVIDVDGQGVPIRMGGQVDCREVQCGQRKNAVIIKGALRCDAVGLLAAAAADVVHGAVVFVDLIAPEHIGPGQRVVMAGEYHVNPQLVHYLGNQAIDLRVAAGFIGVIGRLVQGQDLPVRVAGLNVCLQPLQCAAQLRCVSGIVDNGQIHVAVGAGIAAAAVAGIQAKHGFRLQGLALQLVVTKHLHHVGAAHGLAVKQTGVILPVLIGTGVIHGVAGLETEVPVPVLESVTDGGDVSQIICLDIA